MEHTATLLMRQASMTAATYMTEAISTIDSRFGEGYAEKHPELVGAFMQASALDFLATFLASELRPE